MLELGFVHTLNWFDEFSMFFVAHGYGITRVLQISQVVGDDLSLQSTPPQNVVSHLDNHAVRLLGNFCYYLYMRIELKFTFSKQVLLKGQVFILVV